MCYLQLSNFRTLRCYAENETRPEDEFDGLIQTNRRQIQPIGTRKVVHVDCNLFRSYHDQQHDGGNNEAGRPFRGSSLGVRIQTFQDYVGKHCRNGDVGRGSRRGWRRSLLRHILERRPHFDDALCLNVTHSHFRPRTDVIQLSYPLPPTKQFKFSMKRVVQILGKNDARHFWKCMVLLSFAQSNFEYRERKGVLNCQSNRNTVAMMVCRPCCFFSISSLVLSSVVSRGPRHFLFHGSLACCNKIYGLTIVNQFSCYLALQCTDFKYYRIYLHDNPSNTNKQINQYCYYIWQCNLWACTFETSLFASKQGHNPTWTLPGLL